MGRSFAWLAIALSACSGGSDTPAAASPTPAATTPVPPSPRERIPTAAPFRTVLQLSPEPPSGAGEEGVVVGAFIEVYEAPPSNPSLLRYQAPIPPERTAEDLLGVVVGAALATENGVPIGIAASDRGPRTLDLPRPPGSTALTLVLVVAGDVAAVAPLPPCASAPCAPQTTPPADLVLVLPAADVAAHGIAPGWRYVMDP